MLKMARVLALMVFLLAPGPVQAFIGGRPVVAFRGRVGIETPGLTMATEAQPFAGLLRSWGWGEDGGVNEKRSKLKAQLLDVVASTERGVSTTPSQREEIDQLIIALEDVNPTPDSGSSPLLTAQWDLQWTSEREVLFLIEKGFFGLDTGLVFQAIDTERLTLQNTLCFDGDSFFSVGSSITPEETGPRVDFSFTSCKAKYKGLIVPLPPFGKGWFENVYLDDNFRVSRDVRGDVQVAIKHGSQ